MNKYFVVGNKTSKSLSPTIFNYWFKKYKIRAKYDFIEVNEKKIDLTIKELLKDKNVKGLNVTIPYKQKIMKHINHCDKHAKKINAVNCVSIGRSVVGNNTDWQGYYKSLPKHSKLKNKNILLIGYGGASLAIHYVLKLKGFKNITIINRSKKKIKFVKKNEFTKKIENIDKYLKSADFIINTTPKNPIKPKHIKLVKKTALLSDIVYSPKETAFLKKFPKNKKVYGISMLIEQAVFSFKLWLGFTPLIDSKLIKILDKKIK